MDSTCLFVDKDFISKSRYIETLGDGTFGSVALYDTPRGIFVVKETKMTNKSIGYPPDFLTEMDTLLKLRSVQTIVTLHGICFDPKNKRGYLLLEQLDTNLSQWSRRHSFSDRIKYLPRLINEIGGALGIMHHFSMVHNDMKPNNILVRDTDKGPEFKLADFGKSTYVTDSSIPYGAITKYKPIKQYDIFSSEYWAFMICLVEFILGGKRMIKGSNVRAFYKYYRKDKRFDINRYLKENLSEHRIQSIPKIFWDFISPVINNTNVSIKEGLENINTILNIETIKHVDNVISKKVSKQQEFPSIEREFYTYMKDVNYEHHFKNFRKLFNKFLSVIPYKMCELDIKHYAEVAYVIIVKRRSKHYKYFDTMKQFLEFERAFLTSIGFQTVII